MGGRNVKEPSIVADWSWIQTHVMGIGFQSTINKNMGLALDRSTKVKS
jgi:hypothetical protein